MKTTIVFYALSYALSVVGAPRETNAQRFARGLPPLPPKFRYSPSVSRVKRASTSSTPFTCAAKKPFCCSILESATIPVAVTTLAGLGVPQASAGAQIGIGCVAAPNSNSCSSGSLAQCCGNILGVTLVGIDCVSVPALKEVFHFRSHRDDSYLVLGSCVVLGFVRVASASLRMSSASPTAALR
ncbi:hypothetical protein C8R45DRAFT_930450 [Mycena sanguinolenta]|nr:hypothetical protein C8R45DRAFT_930450 [Mycena sanguinolenta]